MGFYEDRRLANATTMDVAYQAVLKRPAAGDDYFRVVVGIVNGKGEMEAPDGATIYARLLNEDGTVFPAMLFAADAGAALSDSAEGSYFVHAVHDWYQQTVALGPGRFELFIKVANNATEQQLSLELGWIENGTPRYTARKILVGDQADLDSMAAAIAAIATELGDFPTSLRVTLGNPSGVDFAADLAAILAAAGSAGGAQSATVERKLVNSNAVLSADPTVTAVAVTQTADAETYEVMKVIPLALPEGASATIDSIHDLHLKWQSQGAAVAGTGAGKTKWGISDGAETPGAAPTANCVDISSEISETTALTVHELSGPAPTDAIPSDGSVINLVLMGKVTAATDTITCAILDESVLKITYHV
ncbi:MAG: hypothetical protein WCS88_04090 [Patescibacteria group bacterium]|jgi:hypothetical protein